MFVDLMTSEAKDLMARYLRVHPWCHSCGEAATVTRLKVLPPAGKVEWLNVRACCPRCAKQQEGKRNG